jgi:hypothetical protein
MEKQPEARQIKKHNPKQMFSISENKTLCTTRQNNTSLFLASVTRLLAD